MKFVVYSEQSCEGCDYTIGCGRNIAEIDAASMSEARNAVLRALRGKDEDSPVRGSVMENSDDCLAKCVIYAVSEKVAIDVDAERRHIGAAREEERKRASENAERAEFERLRKKFGAAPP